MNLSEIKVVDLSLMISEELPAYWPSHMPFSSKVWNYFAHSEDVSGAIPSVAPYQTRFWVIDEHCGTHFDGPTHFIPPKTSGLPWAGDLGHQTGEQVPLNDFIGRGALIDVSHLRRGEECRGESPWIQVEDIQRWESQHGEIDPGDVVLFRTGWDEFYTTGQEGKRYAYNPLVLKTGEAWPAPNVAAMLYLFEKGVRCVGTDGPSMGAAHDGAPVHHEGLSRGMRFIEALGGLDKLNARDFYFVFLPIKVKGSTGGPGRAVALMESPSSK